jgi:hypothetical protein
MEATLPLTAVSVGYLPIPHLCCRHVHPSYGEASKGCCPGCQGRSKALYTGQKHNYNTKTSGSCSSCKAQATRSAGFNTRGSSKQQVPALSSSSAVPGTAGSSQTPAIPPPSPSAVTSTAIVITASSLVVPRPVPASPVLLGGASEDEPDSSDDDNLQVKPFYHRRNKFLNQVSSVVPTSVPQTQNSGPAPHTPPTDSGSDDAHSDAEEDEKDDAGSPVNSSSSSKVTPVRSPSNSLPVIPPTPHKPNKNVLTSFLSDSDMSDDDTPAPVPVKKMSPAKKMLPLPAPSSSSVQATAITPTAIPTATPVSTLATVPSSLAAVVTASSPTASTAATVPRWMALGTGKATGQVVLLSGKYNNHAAVVFEEPSSHRSTYKCFILGRMYVKRTTPRFRSHNPGTFTALQYGSLKRVLTIADQADLDDCVKETDARLGTPLIAKVSAELGRYKYRFVSLDAWVLNILATPGGVSPSGAKRPLGSGTTKAVKKRKTAAPPLPAVSGVSSTSNSPSTSVLVFSDSDEDTDAEFSEGDEKTDTGAQPSASGTPSAPPKPLTVTEALEHYKKTLEGLEQALQTKQADATKVREELKDETALLGRAEDVHVKAIVVRLKAAEEETKALAVMNDRERSVKQVSERVSRETASVHALKRRIATMKASPPQMVADLLTAMGLPPQAILGQFAAGGKANIGDDHESEERPYFRQKLVQWYYSDNSSTSAQAMKSTISTMLLMPSERGDRVETLYQKCKAESKTSQAAEWYALNTVDATTGGTTVPTSTATSSGSSSNTAPQLVAVSNTIRTGMFSVTGTNVPSIGTVQVPANARPQTSSTTEYEISFRQMVQVNANSRVYRRIERKKKVQKTLLIRPGVDINWPEWLFPAPCKFVTPTGPSYYRGSHIEVIDPEVYTKSRVVELSPLDDLYLSIDACFKSERASLPMQCMTIKKIEAIVNVAAVRSFLALDREVRHQMKDAGVSNKPVATPDKWFFHGTAASLKDDILARGLMPSYLVANNAAHGDMYGKGVYLSSSLAFACQYPRNTSRPQDRIMLVTRAVIGLTEVGKMGMTVGTQYKDTGVLHHTLTDTKTPPEQYCLLNHRHAFVAAIVSF